MVERPSTALGRSITRTASTQSYLTIRWLADPAYRDDAFALYAYFRWLDDTVDERLADHAARLDFVARQRRLLRGAVPDDLCSEELLLVDLLRRRDAEGVRTSIDAMLRVMDFDARRRGSLITAGELDEYTRELAVAVTEALHHCIGHGCRAPQDETRYVAVTGAHVAHMLRDLKEDVAAGYVNVPRELLDAGTVSLDMDAPAFRDWVASRVRLARDCFRTGREYLARVESGRCRLAGHAYIARFEWVLDAVERDGYRLRDRYPERRKLRSGLAIATAAVRSAASSAPRSAATTGGRA